MMNKESKSPKHMLMLPGENDWEVWSNSGSVIWENMGAQQFSGENRHYAFSVNDVFSLPLWFNTVDEQVINDAVMMHVEKVGLLANTSSGKSVDYYVVEKEEERCLVTAVVLSENIQTQFSKNVPTAFHVSPLIYSLPENAVIVWKELGQLVMAVTRGRVPVYFQGLSAGHMDKNLARELRCILLELQLHGYSKEISGITLRIDAVTNAQRHLLEEFLKIDTKVETKPSPRLKKKELNLLPPEVALLRSKKALLKKKRNIAAIATTIYCILLGIFFWNYYREWRELKEVKAVLQVDAPDVAEVQKVKEEWNMIEAVIDTDRSPLEVLLRCAMASPKKDLRFTHFEASREGVYIRGEAARAQLALDFDARLSQSALLEDYIWEAPSPDILSDNKARFNITGTARNRLVDEEQ